MTSARRLFASKQCCDVKDMQFAFISCQDTARQREGGGGEDVVVVREEQRQNKGKEGTACKNF